MIGFVIAAAALLGYAALVTVSTRRRRRVQRVAAQQPSVGPVSSPSSGASPSGAGEDLAEAAAAFLSGTYRAHLEGKGRPVPPWAWLNRLAHGTFDDVTGLARRDGRVDGPEAITAAVAGRVVNAVEQGHTTLEAVQRDTLRPLEEQLRRLPWEGEDETARADRLARAILDRLPPEGA